MPVVHVHQPVVEITTPVPPQEMGDLQLLRAFYSLVEAASLLEGTALGAAAQDVLRPVEGEILRRMAQGDLPDLSEAEDAELASLPAALHRLARFLEGGESGPEVGRRLLADLHEFAVWDETGDGRPSTLSRVLLAMVGGAPAEVAAHEAGLVRGPVEDGEE